MSWHVVTGGAGTGKTTRIFALMEEWLSTRSLSEGQSVLALTFMHGSRIRLSDRLQRSSARGRFECITFDGFARELCSRWKSRLAAMQVALPSEHDPSIYEKTCDAAALLLDDATIARWVAATHPLVIVDEFQDCYGSRPRLVHALGAAADVLIAADPFQDLQTTGNNPAIATLLAAKPQLEELAFVHRTRVAALLSGATDLRSGNPVRTGHGLAIEAVPTHHMGAAKLCAVIARLRGASAAVLSAGQLAPNNFARKVLDAAASTKGYGKLKNLGPYKIPFESSADAYRAELLAALDLGDIVHTATEIRAVLPPVNPLTRHMLNWLEHQRRMRGRVEFDDEDIRAQVARAEASHRSLPIHRKGLTALTLHQAKNREFEHVIVLWGYSVPTDCEMRRRWLYNAITRAQKTATVIVHSQKLLSEPPFA